MMQPVTMDEVQHVGLDTLDVLETIARAARRRHKLALDYVPLGAIRSNGDPIVDRDTGKAPEPGLREFIPYSLRRSKAGHVFLMGANGRERVRAYRLDCIRRAEELLDTFTPEYEVEF